MAELIKIQPQVPDITPGVRRVPTPGASYLGQAFGEFGETFDRLQFGADKAAAVRSVEEGKAELKAKIQSNYDSIVDADEFLEKTTADTEELYQRRIADVNPRVRQLIDDGLAPERIAFRESIKHLHRQKVGDKMKADYIVDKDALAQSAVTGTPEEQKAAIQKFGDLLGTMHATGNMKREEAAKEAIGFRKKVQADSMNLLAQSKPVDFIKKHQAGDYANVDAVDVQRALDIAQRVETARAQKDKTEMEAISREAERTYEQLAAERRLDVDDLKRAARFYGWSDDKVNGLIKMQIGLKAANPYETASIEDAMSPVDRSVRPGMTDIRQAERNLANLAKGGQVSTSTPEYRAAMRRLQSMYDRLDVRGDIKERQATFDARQAIDGLYREFLPGNTSKGVVADKARRLREVTDLDPAEQRRYVDNFRKELEKQRAENQAPQINRGKLRSIQP